MITTIDNQFKNHGQSTTYTTRPLRELTLRVLLYYDLFLYPITLHEIHRFCESDDYSLEEINAELANLADREIVSYQRGFWYMSHQNQEIVERRIQMEERGAQMWKIARRFGRLMRAIPFVRGVFISGQLSRYIADEESDIDYFIVTEPGRLWIVRTLLVLFRRTILLNNRKYFCTNYYVTTNNLQIQERSIYTACEVAALKPLWNRALFKEMIESNQWITDYYPNFSIDDVELRAGISEKKSRLQTLLEYLIPDSIAARLDKKFMETTRSFLKRKFPGRSHQTYEVSLRCAPDESRAHPEDQAIHVLNRYHGLLRTYGIPESKACSND